MTVNVKKAMRGLRKSYTVTVKQEHWDEALSFVWRTREGERLIRDNHCPLALALAEKSQQFVTVGRDFAMVDHWSYKLDKNATRLVIAFDEEKKIKLPLKVKVTTVWD